MSASLLSGIHQVEQVVRNTVSGDRKAADLSRETAEVNPNTKLTTDYGAPISNTDNWLRLVDAQRTGPSLLEDPIAREKVRFADSALEVAALRGISNLCSHVVDSSLRP
jgi:catalase